MLVVGATAVIQHVRRRWIKLARGHSTFATTRRGVFQLWGMSVKNMRCPEPFISARGAARRDDARAGPGHALGCRRQGGPRLCCIRHSDGTLLKLCETAGLVKLGHVALDGTKIKANASKHKAMSYERMKKREAELKAEVARMLAAAEAADAQEDETFGKDKRGDEMPDWVGDKQERLAKIQQAMAALEAEAMLAAEEERRIEAEKEQQRQAEGRKKPGKPAAPPSDQPDPKSQRNFTDPDSRIMKSKDGFVQAYNAQAAVEREKVPRNWPRFRDSVTDNFRIISPRNFRVMT